MKEVLTFRVETNCFFGGLFYKATDDVAENEQGHWQFPAGQVFDVPQHFTAVDEVTRERDDEAQDLREAFFAVAIPAARSDAPHADRLAEVARLKANFLAYGQAEALVDANGDGEIGVEEMSKKQLIDALRKFNVEFKATETVAELVAKLKAARSGSV